MDTFTDYFHAHRAWEDAETYLFTTVGSNGNPLASPQINRDRFYVFHRQNLIGDEGSISYKGMVFGLPNTAVAGFDDSHLSFDRQRGFPNNDLVDPFNPSPGLFGALDPVPRDSPQTHWNDYAAFFEDVIDLGAPVKLVTGARYVPAGAGSAEFQDQWSGPGQRLHANLQLDELAGGIGL